MENHFGGQNHGPTAGQAHQAGGLSGWPDYMHQSGPHSGHLHAQHYYNPYLASHFITQHQASTQQPQNQPQNLHTTVRPQPHTPHTGKKKIKVKMS